MKVNYSFSSEHKGKVYIQFGVKLKDRFYRKRTGVCVEAKYWNKRTHRVAQSCSDHIEHNRLLDLFQKRFNDLYYDSLSAGYEINKRLIDNKVFGESNVQHSVDSDFKAFIWGLHEAKRKDPTHKKHSLRPFRSMFVALSEFEETNGVVHFEDLTTDFFEDFKSFLNSDRKTNDSTTGKYMSNLRSFVKQADKLKLPVPEDYKDIKVKDYKAYHVYLSVDELMRLYHFEYKPSRLKNAVRLFLIGAFTGLRFGDVHKLELENIRSISGKDMIYIQQQKTAGDPVIIPIHPLVKEILAGGMPIKLCNQKHNQYIKEAARLAGITQKIVHYFNRAGHDVSEVREKCDLVSTHTARRSMVTNMVLQGIPNNLVMKISGHKTESAFRRYLCMDNELSAVLLAGHDFFN